LKGKLEQSKDLFDGGASIYTAVNDDISDNDDSDEDSDSSNADGDGIGTTQSVVDRIISMHRHYLIRRHHAFYEEMPPAAAAASNNKNAIRVIE
jgi:hypothetical protein